VSTESLPVISKACMVVREEWAEISVKLGGTAEVRLLSLMDKACFFMEKRRLPLLFMGPGGGAQITNTKEKESWQKSLTVFI